MVIVTILYPPNQGIVQFSLGKSSYCCKVSDVGKPEVLNQRKILKCYNDGLVTGAFHDSPKLYYH